MAVLTVVGIMVTTWSWFGTNQLGAGLHAYGFNKSLADGCEYTWIICMGFIALGMVPLKYWRSFSGTGMPRPETVEPAISKAGLGNTQIAGQNRNKRGNRQS
jgi:hypothetical protein